MSAPIVHAGAVEHVRRAARFALAVESRTATDPGGLDWAGVEPDGWLDAVALHRLAPLLAPHLDAMAAPGRIRAAVHAMVRDDALRALRLASESQRAMSALAEAGINALLFKGIALSLQTTGTLAARGAGDIDILVRPQDVARAHAVLEEAGWAGEEIHDGAPFWWGHYLRVRRERSYVRPTSVIDLHWRVGWHARPVPAAALLLARAERVPLAGADVPTLGLPDAFAVACYSAAVDRYARLRSLVDVVRLARRPDLRVVPGTDWRLRRLVAESVAIAVDLLGGVPQSTLEQWAPPGSVDLPRLRATWAQSSVHRAWIDDDISLGQMLGIYRDSARFAGWPAAAGMAAVDGLLPPERIPPGTGPVGTASAVARELADLVQRRVMPGAGVPRAALGRPKA